MEHPEIERLLRIADPDNPEDVKRLKKLLYRTGLFPQRSPLVLPYPPQHTSWTGLVITDPSSSEYHLPIHGPSTAPHIAGDIRILFSAQGIYLPFSSSWHHRSGQTRVNNHEILPYNQELAKWLLEHYGVIKAGIRALLPEEENQAAEILGEKNFQLNPGWIPCCVDTTLQLDSYDTHYAQDLGVVAQNLIPFNGRIAVFISSTVLPSAEDILSGPLLNELFALLHSAMIDTNTWEGLNKMGELLWETVPDVSDVFPGAQMHNPALQYSIGEDEE